ncbi:MAG: cytochrome c peroxidase [Deltaproteobacteria bacterium]
MEKKLDLKRSALALLVGAAVSCGTETPRATDTPTDAIQPTDVVQQDATYSISCPPGFNTFIGPPPAGALPFAPLASLKTVPNPVFDVDPKTGALLLRGDLGAYIADMPTAIQLGKALFWDIQAGSDAKVACATCHFQGGADTRAKNQINPGANGSFDLQSTNYTLTATDFPFVDPITGRNNDNATGSQGVRRSSFVSIGTNGVESTTPINDPVFGTLRQSTGVNAPTVVNALYNHRNFFNGRAQNIFNGVNPWNDRDPTAKIWKVVDTLGNVQQIDIHIPNAALASQAVGPPLNTTEMSADGRTFPELGKKMLLVKPLGLQKVDARDSVLGALAENKIKGLHTTYAALIQKAFQPNLWNTTQTVTINNKAYTLTQANFSLFWGLAIMLYEGTLVADNSPMDQYVASRTFDAAGNLTASNPALLDPVVNRLAAEGITIPLAAGGTRAVTRADILLGLDLFEKPLPAPTVAGLPPGTGVGCSLCHVGAETTSASIRNVTVGVEAGDVAFKNAGFDLRLERMFMGVRTPPPTPPQPPPPVPFLTDVITYDTATYGVTVTSINGVPVTPQAMTVNTYDAGWYNIGVRPTADNIGLGGLDAFGKPLSWTRFFQTTLANPSIIKVGGGGLTCIDSAGNPVVPPAAPVGSPFVGEVLTPGTSVPILSGGLTATEATDVMGSFKTSSLRNVEFNGPYFHSGGKATLRQVVDFYDDGGNFSNTELAPLIRPLGLTEAQIDALVAFLLSLTDDRVRFQQAPFDHPELPIPAGQDASGADIVTLLPAVGATGSTTQIPRFLSLNPFRP